VPENPETGGARAIATGAFGAGTRAFAGTTGVSADAFEANTPSNWGTSCLPSIAGASAGAGKAAEFSAAQDERRFRAAPARRHGRATST